MTDEAVAETTPGAIKADHVEISQSGAQLVDAQTVAINQGGAAQVRAQEVSVSQGGIALARAEHLDLREGSSAFAVLADEAKVEGGATVLLLVSGETSGDVRPMLTLPTAFAIGAGLGLAIAFVRRLL